MIDKVIQWRNGMVMVFGTDGEQIPEYQGPVEDVRDKINAVFSGEWLYGDWKTGKMSTLHFDEWENKADDHTIKVEIPKISYQTVVDYSLDKKVFKLYIGKEEVFSILMQLGEMPIAFHDTKVKCLYSILSQNYEILMMFLLQLERDGKL